MKKPQSFMLEVIRTSAIRARATRTEADAAALAIAVVRAFGCSYEQAAHACRTKYGVSIADKSAAGRSATCTKDGIFVGYDPKGTSVSVVEPKRNAVPAYLLAGI